MIGSSSPSPVADQRKSITIAGLFAATMTAAVPLIYGSMAGVVCERVGVVNIAIEGQLLVGAFTGIVFASMCSEAPGGACSEHRLPEHLSDFSSRSSP